MKNQIFNFDSITFKKHKNSEGVQGLLQIGKYELSVVAGESFYSSVGRDYYEVDNRRRYLSFEVAIWEENQEEKQDISTRFFVGEFATDNNVLGWQSESQITRLIGKIESALPQQDMYYNYSPNGETCDAFIELQEKLGDKINIPALDKIKTSEDANNILVTESWTKFIGAGFMDNENVKIKHEEYDRYQSQIIDGKKYTFSISVLVSSLKIKYVDFVSSDYDDTTPHLKSFWLTPSKKANEYKYESYVIVGSSRALTPAGMLKKVEERNANCRISFNLWMEHEAAFNKQSELIKEAYPNAIITQGKSRYINTNRKMVVTFKAGSKLFFDISTWNKEPLTLTEVQDEQAVSYSNWSTWADRFNKQK